MPSDSRGDHTDSVSLATISAYHKLIISLTYRPTQARRNTRYLVLSTKIKIPHKSKTNQPEKFKNLAERTQKSKRKWSRGALILIACHCHCIFGTPLVVVVVVVILIRRRRCRRHRTRHSSIYSLAVFKINNHYESI